ATWTPSATSCGWRSPPAAGAWPGWAASSARVGAPPNTTRSARWAPGRRRAGRLDPDGGLLCAPWLSGERVPVFDARARAAFVGLDLSHDRGDLLRALMEGVAYQMRWSLEYAAACGEPIGELRAVGGGGIGGAWTQIIADVLERPLGRGRAPPGGRA